jgi:archaellum component FlaF (FlaF/FlaG flagellin family)
MRLYSESNGSYSQTLKIGSYKSEVEVTRDGQQLFKGEATHIIDNGHVLSFKDNEGKKHEFVKGYNNSTL